MTSPVEGSRLVIISNRLPVTVKNIGHDRYESKASSGGLVAGIRGLLNSGVDHIWCGWPGEEIAMNSVSELSSSLQENHKAIPVLLDKRTSDLHYNGFSNSTLWPLLHYQPDKVFFDNRYMNAYREANEVFADTVACHLQDGDQIWVHDYHLMLLPLMLRQKAATLNLKINIGWFLHTPFPECGFFETLPDGAEILNGTLGADVVGFQTDQFRHNFLATCSQILKWWTTDTGILCDGREVSAQTFPIGIEPYEYQGQLRKRSVQDTLCNIKHDFHGSKLILGVDRLDCIKGLPQKLHAFDELLDTNAELVGQVVLLQLVVPSRDDLKTHQDLKEEIQKLVGSINGKHGKINYTPVRFLYTTIDPGELTALYAAADVCFVSSTRDGMNLVCYEYVACHSPKAVLSSNEYIAPGSLVLSKFAGAANVMEGALIVNPWDKGACAASLLHALRMSVGESSARMKVLADLVERQTSSQWGSSFVEALEQVNKVRMLKEKRRCDSAIEIADPAESCSQWL